MTAAAPTWAESSAKVPKRPCGVPPAPTCPTMQTALRAAGERFKSDRVARRPGLDVVVLLGRGKKGRADIAPIIIYRRSSADAGVVLNFCPWCGGTLREGAKRWGAEKPKAKPVKRGS